MNPLAPHDLPAFIVGPDGADPLLSIIGVFVLGAVFVTGLVFLWLHSLPERMAHKSQKLQFEIVAVLCLLALFTHNNTLWVVALLLAIIDLPDFATPLNRIASSAEALAATGPAKETAIPVEDVKAAAETAAPLEAPGAAKEETPSAVPAEQQEGAQNRNTQDNA